jgi:two-component system, cell cycle response regulator DivK
VNVRLDRRFRLQPEETPWDNWRLMSRMDELARSGERRTRPLILIVEDQVDLRQLYAEQLAMCGFDVIQAGNGADAIEHTTSHAPDVVLMDLSLPVVDGWEATRRLKSDQRTAHIPVVALTAHDGSGELQRATRAGCDWFVPKPCPPDALITEVRRVLAGRPS